MTDILKIKVGDKWVSVPAIKGDMGEGIPTGGTTGQSLVKKSNAHYDTKWANTNFIFEQAIASDTWVINHNLNKKPVVNLVDSSGRGFEAYREYPSNNQVIVRLNAPTTGYAYLT